MKKLIIIIATALIATAAWAQSGQLQTVKGKTKDGKRINVQYYKGTAQDRIESVKYELVDELQAENKNKQNTINDLQNQLNNANKRIDKLNNQLKDSGNSEQITELQGQVSQKDIELEQKNEQIRQLEAQLSSLQNENQRLQRQVDSLNYVNQQLRQKKSRIAMTSVLGVEANVGSVLLSKKDLTNPWEKALSWNKQVTLYYGTSRLSESFPVSIEAGLGFRSLPMKARIDHHEVSDNLQQDCDNVIYRPDYVFDDFSEKLTVNCLEVPVRICIGQPDNSKVSVYTKLGVTPSFILSAYLANGSYSKTGYYPNWNVTFEDIEELGFFNNGGEGNQKMTPTKRFNLWGNAAFGAYVPLNSSILFNVGAKLDYPILTTGSFTYDVESSTSATDNKSQLLPDALPAGLANYNGRMLIPSLQAGIIYTLK